MSEAADILEREMDMPYWQEELSGSRLMELIEEVRALEAENATAKATIAEREAEIERLKVEVQAYKAKNMDAELRAVRFEVGQLNVALSESQAQVAVLREALEFWNRWSTGGDFDGKEAERLTKAALSSTSQASTEYRERIRAETIEECAKIADEGMYGTLAASRIRDLKGTK